MIKLSIIIPSLRPQNLAKLVESIIANTFMSYEIIVIGKKSHYNEEDFEKWNHKIYYIEDKYLIGTTKAIEQGLEKASGEYIVTLSDDCLVLQNWANNMLNFLEENPKKLLLGNFRVFDKTGELGDIGYYNIPFSMFPFIKKENLEEIGGYFDTEFNAFYSDPDLGLRVEHSGGKTLTCPNAWIYHPYNPDVLHNYNKEQYFKKDEEKFLKKWEHLGEFKGCKRIEPNIIHTHPNTLPFIIGG